MTRREIFILVFCLATMLFGFGLVQLANLQHDKAEEQCQAKGGVVVWSGYRGNIATCVDPKVIIK